MRVRMRRRSVSSFVGLAFGRLRVGREDVEDEGGPVDDLDLDLVLQIAELSRAQLAVADHGVGPGRHHDLPELVDLPAPDERRRIGSLPALHQAVQDLGSGGLGEQPQLGQRVGGVGLGAVRPDPHQDHALQTQAAVLDLGDVVELGAKPVDTAE